MDNLFATCSANGKASYEAHTDLVELVKICRTNHPDTNITITDCFGEFVAYVHHTQNHA